MRDIVIESQSALDEILGDTDWDHTFIREAHLVSPSYIDVATGATYAPDMLPHFYVLICSCPSSPVALEFQFWNVEYVNIPCQQDVLPSGKVHHNYIEFWFLPPWKAWSTPDLIARQLRISVLGREAHGWHLRYGKTNPFDEYGMERKDC